MKSKSQTGETYSQRYLRRHYSLNTQTTAKTQLLLLHKQPIFFFKEMKPLTAALSKKLYKHIKRCPCQTIKCTLRQQWDNTQLLGWSTRRMESSRNSCSPLEGCRMRRPLWRTVSDFLQNWAYLTMRIWTFMSTQNSHMGVYSSFIHKYRDFEARQLLFSVCGCTGPSRRWIILSPRNKHRTMKLRKDTLIPNVRC